MYSLQLPPSLVIKLIVVVSFEFEKGMYSILFNKVDVVFIKVPIRCEFKSNGYIILDIVK